MQTRIAILTRLRNDVKTLSDPYAAPYQRAPG